MSVLYAWLRRHPVLVDGMLAFFLALTGLPQIISRHWPHFLFMLLLVVPVAFRRRSPVLAFALAAAGGAGLILLRTGWVGADVAIVVLLYTLAAYRPRRESVAGLAVTLLGSAVALVIGTPVTGIRNLHMLVSGMVVLGGTALAAWVLGDSMRYRRAYYLALEDRAARLERERDAQARLGAAAESWSYRPTARATRWNQSQNEHGRRSAPSRRQAVRR